MAQMVRYKKCLIKNRDCEIQISNITKFILVVVIFILQLVSIIVCEESVGEGEVSEDFGRRFGPPVNEEDREYCIKNATFTQMGRMKDYLTPGYEDFISSINLTWAGAVECCITHHMELLPYVSMRTREKYGQLSGHAWINTNDIVKEGQWLWPDGREVSDELWDQDQWVSDNKNPNNEKGEEHCGQMLVNFKYQVTLNDAHCAIKNYFICRRRTSLTKERPPAEKTIKHMEKLRNEICDKTVFTPINERDFLSSTKLDWHGASDCCKKRDTVLLLSLKHETKRDFQNIKERVWVGVSDFIKQEVDVLDNHDEHRPWSSQNEHHEFGREEGCPVIHHSKRKDTEEDDIFLNDFNCHISLAFVCQQKPSKSIFGDEASGSRSFGARTPIINSHHSESGEAEEQKCSDEFSKIDHSGFKISNFKLSQSNASECCQVHNGALLGHLIPNKNLTTRVWTDVKYKKELSAFVWSHNGKVVDKHLWSETPDYDRDKTECASLVMHEDHENHKLRVTDCQQKLHFICYPLQKKSNTKPRGRTAINLSKKLADFDVAPDEVELCKETKFSPLTSSNTILVSNTKLKWERAKECCGYFHMYLYFSFDSSQMMSLARLISKPAWISQIVPNSTVRNIQKAFKVLSKPFEVKAGSTCNALAPSAFHKSSNSTLIHCHEHLNFICQDFRMCETEHFPGLHLSSIWKTEPEYAVVNRDNIKTAKEELIYLHTLSPLPKIPIESYKYLQWSRRIFSKICPEYPVAEFLVKSISRHFRRFLYYHYDDYHSQRDHKMEIHRHGRILKSLHQCFNQSEPFKFTMETTKEFCSRQTCNFKVADKNSSSSSNSSQVTPTLYCECNEKILEVTVNASYAYNVSSRALEKQNLHFDLELVDLVVEFIWKVILFSHYLCAEYFIDSDLSFMYDEMEAFLLFDPIMLFRWENLNVQENKFWESLYPTYDLTSFSDGVDACVSAAINVSQYQTLLIRPTQFTENANDKAVKLLKPR